MCAICRRIRNGETKVAYDIYAHKPNQFEYEKVNMVVSDGEVYLQAIVESLVDARALHKIPIYITHCPFCGEAFFEEDAV